MKLDPAQISTLSSLLDQALDQSVEARRAWLDQLGADHAALKPLLEAMLAVRDGVETVALIDTLPQFEVSPERTFTHVAGEVVGPYRLLHELGRGGMGEVWLAERSDGLLRRPVALKLPLIAAARQVLVDRFNRESEILARLTHPNIARLYDVGFTAEGEPYLALEYVEGTPITTYCDGLRLGARQRAALYRQALAAVQYAHSNLILHRDLKPSNIMVTPAGEVKLLDFGIAKLMTDGNTLETELTRVGGRALTLDYASPEQIGGAPLTTASDVYSLGVVFYELLTGTRPYRLKRGTRGELEDAILAADAARPSVALIGEAAAQNRGGSRKAVSRELAGDLDSITLKSLQRSLDLRYPTAAALDDDLQRYLDGRVVRAQPETLWYRWKKRIARNKLATGAIAAVAGSLVLGVSATAWQASVARQQARVAEREANASNAVASFLIGLFSANDLRTSSPTVGKQLTADQLLDIGYERSKTELKDAPEVRNRLLAALGEIYKSMDETDKAIAVTKERIALLQSTAGSAIDIANAYSQLSIWVLAYDRESEADGYLQLGLKALSGLDSQEARTQRGNLYMALGEIAYGRDLDRANDYYTKAVDLLSQHPVKEDEYPTALQGLAYTQTILGNRERGLQLMATMREERIKRWGAESMMVDAVDNMMTGLYIMTGQTSAADRNNLRNVASMEKKTQPLDFSLLNAKSLRGRILIDQERYPEALESLAQVRSLVESKHSDEATVTSVLMIDKSIAYLGEGDVVAAQRAADEALAFVEKRAPESSRHTNILTHYGRLMMLAGRYDDANASLRRAQEQVKALPPFNSSVPALLAVRLADNAIASGAYDHAKTWLVQAESTIKPQSPWADYVADAIATRRARLQMETGDYAASLTLSQQTLERQQKRTEPNAKRELQADLELLEGRALLGLNRVADAVVHLREARKMREIASIPDSVWIAEVDVYLAECERQLGHIDVAKTLTAQADRVYAIQGDRAAFLQLPLKRLHAAVL